MPENFQVPAALDEIYFFHSTTLFVVTKNSSHSPFRAGIWQISSSLWWNAFFHATNYNFNPGIVSYPNYWKTLPRMSQWIHNVAKITRFFATFLAALLVKSCTLLTSSSIKPSGVSPLWFYHKLKFLYSMNKHQKRWLVLPQQLNFLTELCEMPPAVQSSILWLVRTTA